jgi:uncharacterized protein
VAPGVIGTFRRLGLILATVAPTACAAEPAQQVAQPLVGPVAAGRVVDEANLIPAENEQRLTAELERVERELGPQFVVVTVNSLNGSPIEDYSIDLARRWGIGHRDRNDGLMLLVAPNERKMRIEVGYGLERRVTDPYAAKVIREQLLPAFQEGRYSEGIERGASALIDRLASRHSDQEIARIDGVVG